MSVVGRFDFDVLNDFGRIFNENAVNHGFRDEDKSLDSELMLIASEAFEAFEHWRDGTENDPSEKIPECSNLAEELADIVIRVLETAYDRKIDIADAIYRKHRFNVMRPYKHGKVH